MKLEKMTEQDYAFWVSRCKTQYAKDKEKANDLTPKEAMEIAERDFSEILPEGILSKDNFFYTIKVQKSKVGYLWFRLQGSEDNKKAFLLDIIIESEQRGKGYGKNAMFLLEDEVKSLGISEIGLHVFGFNELATQLYKSLNYKITDLVMAKTLN